MIVEIIEHRAGWSLNLIDERGGWSYRDGRLHASRSACVAAALCRIFPRKISFVDRIDPVNR